MRIYRNEYFVDGESGGSAFFTSRKAADVARATVFRENGHENEPVCEQEHADVAFTREGVLRILRKWAAHPDNG